MPRCLLSPLSLSLVLGIFDGAVVYLSLSLRCWANPNPFWGLGFPLCLLCEFLFLGVDVGLVFFFGGVLPMLCFDILACRARSCVEKFLFMSGLPFLGLFSLPQGFRVDDVFALLFERCRSGSHRTHPTLAPFWYCSFSFFCPRRMRVIAHFGRASLLFWCFLGVPFRALRVLVFLDSLGNSWGLSSLAPSEAPFSDARRQGCLRRFSFVVFVFPLLSCLRLHTLEGPPRDLAEAGPGVLARPGRSDSQGSPSRAEDWTPPCLDRVFFPGVCVGVAGIPKALLRQRTFWVGVPFYTGRPPRSSHARFSPRLFALSLFLSLVFFFLSLEQTD